MGQAGEARDRLSQRLAVAGHELAGEPDGGDDGDLLAEDGAHAELEAVPGAGHAQARPRGDQRRKMRILRQVFADRQRIGRQVEHAAHAGDDGRQGVELRKADRHGEPVAVGRPGDDRAHGAADARWRGRRRRPRPRSTPGMARGARKARMASQS